MVIGCSKQIVQTVFDNLVLIGFNIIKVLVLSNACIFCVKLY